MRHWLAGFMVGLFCHYSLAVERPQWISAESWQAPQIYRNDTLLRTWQPPGITQLTRQPKLILCQLEMKSASAHLGTEKLTFRVQVDDQPQPLGEHDNQQSLFFNLPADRFRVGSTVKIQLTDHVLLHDSEVGMIAGVFHGEFPFVLQSAAITSHCYDFDGKELNAWFLRKQSAFLFQLKLVQQSLLLNAKASDWGYRQSGIEELTGYVIEMGALVGWEDSRLQSLITDLNQLHLLWYDKLHALLHKISQQVPPAHEWVNLAKGDLQVQLHDFQCGEAVLQPYREMANLLAQKYLQTAGQCVYFLKIKNTSNSDVRITHLPAWVGEIKQFSVVSEQGDSSDLTILATEGKGISPGQQAIFLPAGDMVTIALVADKTVERPMLLRLKTDKQSLFLKVVSQPQLI